MIGHDGELKQHRLGMFLNLLGTFRECLGTSLSNLFDIWEILKHQQEQHEKPHTLPIGNKRAHNCNTILNSLPFFLF
jgi:hypothetical protein